MRRIVWIALAAAALAAAAGGCARSRDESARMAQAVRYYCPMHPTYMSDNPGDCPICGMRLVRMDANAGEAAARHAEPGSAPAHGGAPVRGASEGVEGYATVTLTPEMIRLAGVQTAPVERGIASRVVRTVGTVAADESRVRRVSTKVAGYVEKLFVNFTGQPVLRGQPVLTIYSPELLSGQEELLRAKGSAARAAASSDPGIRRRGEELLDAARRRLALFDVPQSFIEEVEASGETRREVTLLAPVSGYVTSKSTFEGARTEPGAELYTVTDLSQVWIEAQVYEYEAAAVRAGQPATLTLPYDPAVRLEGKIAYVNPYLDPASRTITARLSFANPDLALKPGMFANVELVVPGSEGLTVPADAILDTGTRRIVFVDAGGGVFEPREVVVGVRAGGRAQVLSGVTAGERVVVKANFLLDSESRLRAGFSNAAAAGEGPGGHAMDPRGGE